MTNTIPVPPRTADRLKELIAQRNQLNMMIDVVVATASELLDVPPDYELFNIDVGWRPKNRHTTKLEE